MERTQKDLDPEERKKAMATVQRFLQEEDDEEIGRLLKLLGCEILNCDIEFLEKSLQDSAVLFEESDKEGKSEA